MGGAHASVCEVDYDWVGDVPGRTDGIVSKCLVPSACEWARAVRAATAYADRGLSAARRGWNAGALPLACYEQHVPRWDRYLQLFVGYVRARFPLAWCPRMASHCCIGSRMALAHSRVFRCAAEYEDWSCFARGHVILALKQISADGLLDQAMAMHVLRLVPASVMLDTIGTIDRCCDVNSRGTAAMFPGVFGVMQLRSCAGIALEQAWMRFACNHVQAAQSALEDSYGCL